MIVDDDTPKPPVDQRTWIQTDRPIARRIGRPIREFLAVQTSGGVVLMIATVAALILANSPWGSSIAEFWERKLILFEFGDFHLEETLIHWINDGLMVIFFFVVGLEIKREIVVGELRDVRQAALPVAAAIGGMVVPALIYFVLNPSGEASRGWGVPMATDIAFAVGVLALLGDRVPDRLRVFVLTLAIVDDIGAILVIAVFYTTDLNTGWLIFAFAMVGVVALLQVARVWYIPIYVIVGFLVWLGFLESGVHATIAGVILGLMTPARPLRPLPTEVKIGPDTPWSRMQALLFDARESLPVAERLEHALHPWSAFVILPLFAFANAGIRFSSEMVEAALASAVVYGVILGLVVGKPVGIFAASWLAVKTNLAQLPARITWPMIVGAGSLAGIGFTMSLFISGLAFTDQMLVDEAKVAILVASVVSAVAGALILIANTKGSIGEE